MYIDKVRLTNIRGFRDQEFSFDRGNGIYAGWTILTGNNGSGKSTVLQSIALNLLDTQTALSLTPDLISLGRQQGEESILSLHLSGNKDEFRFKFNGNSFSARSWTSDSDRRLELFSCGYGPFRRLSGASEAVARLMQTERAGRFATLFHESASLSEADKWLRTLKHKQLEGKQPAAQTLEAVLELFNDEFLPNCLVVDRVDSDGLWLKDREGQMLSWAGISDGYRSALALLTDILRHLINHYGLDGLTARDAEGRLFITRKGVVLIDEIDAHLHPEWQREIGFWLKKRFPNIQFIVTSHSPLICQAADPNGLFVLPEPGSDEPARALTAEEYQEVISSRPDTILRSAAFGLQNTRSPVAVEARSAFADLRTKQRAGGKLTQAEQVELERLRQYINPDEEP